MGFKLRSSGPFKMMGSSPAKQGTSYHKTEGQDENKIFDEENNHIGNYENDKAVYFSDGTKKTDRDKFNDAENQHEMLHDKTNKELKPLEFYPPHVQPEQPNFNLPSTSKSKKELFTSISKNLKTATSKIKTKKKTVTSKIKTKKKSPPTKWVQFIPMALSALGSMNKNKE
jgi:hypothetical protein